MIEFILGAFLYAKIKHKYSLKYIFKSWEIIPPLLFAIFYIYLEISIWYGNYSFVPYSYYIKTATLLSYIPLIIKYGLYEDDNGFILTSPMIVATICLGLGSQLNKIVMRLNNGFMPSFPSVGYSTGFVKPDFVEDGIHILGNAYSHLIPLCNIFDIGIGILSPGDILVRFYVFIILYYTIKYSNKKEI